MNKKITPEIVNEILNTPEKYNIDDLNINFGDYSKEEIEKLNEPLLRLLKKKHEDNIKKNSIMDKTINVNDGDKK
jgi:hypothetical protein